MKSKKSKLDFPSATTIAEIEKLIRFVRGHKIILDRELAKIFGISITVLKQALERDAPHLPDELVFRLTPEEAKLFSIPILKKSREKKNSLRGTNSKNLPFAFTERGLLMSAGILHSQSATSENRDQFKQLLAALHELADNFRKSDEFEAEERRRQPEEHRARLRQSQLQASASAIKDGLNDLKPGIIPTRWWWLQSQSQWETFQDDHWAQGYELMRRSLEHHNLLLGTIVGPHYSPIPVEKDPTHRSWIGLSRREQDHFRSGFKEMLGSLGFRVGSGIRVGNKSIVFDCSKPLKRMLSLLESGLKAPTPVIIGHEIRGTGAVSTVNREQNPSAGDSGSFTTYLKSRKQFSNWKVLDDEQPEWIHLPLPDCIKDKKERIRTLNDKEILTAFETFIRKPPSEFRKHRAKQRRRHRRLDVPKPRTLVLGIMAHDHKLLSKSKLTHLILWLNTLDNELLMRLGLRSCKNSKRKAYTDLVYAQRKLEELLKQTISSRNLQR